MMAVIVALAVTALGLVVGPVITLAVALQRAGEHMDDENKAAIPAVSRLKEKHFQLLNLSAAEPHMGIKMKAKDPTQKNIYISGTRDA